MMSLPPRRGELFAGMDTHEASHAETKSHPIGQLATEWPCRVRSGHGARDPTAPLRSAPLKSNRSFVLLALAILIDGGRGTTPGGASAGTRLRETFSTRTRFAPRRNFLGPGVAPRPDTADPNLPCQQAQKERSGAAGAWSEHGGFR